MFLQINSVVMIRLILIIDVMNKKPWERSQSKCIDAMEPRSKSSNLDKGGVLWWAGGGGGEGGEDGSVYISSVK